MDKTEKETMKHEHGYTSPLGPDLCEYMYVSMCPYVHVLSENPFFWRCFCQLVPCRALSLFLVVETSIFLFAWTYFTPCGMFL